LTLKITSAAKWLAINGPGANALRACRSKFGLNAVQLAKTCTQAAAIRSERRSRNADVGGVSI